MQATLTFLDYTIILSYMLFALIVGVLLSRRASENTENYFLGGRNMPWWLIGISMIATSYASDTPLAITEMVRRYGIQRIWWFLSSCLVLIVGIFLFSRLWRRAEITTDAEFYELRYDGRAASFLRGLRAFYAGIIHNILTMSYVTLAMSSIITTLTDLNRWVVIIICVCVALLYATFSGFYGVVVTDFVQFFIAVGSMIYLTIVAIKRVGGVDLLLQRISSMPGYGPQSLSIFPDFSTFNIDLVALLIFIGILWWSDASGYNMQRMSACKDERHSILATLFYAIFQTSRAWIWIGIALVSILLFPQLSYTPYTDTHAYPLVMNAYLEPGIKGILVTAFLAAFMSTIDTHLNWGASYIMTDVYKRFLKPNASERHYMVVTRLVVVGFMVITACVVPFIPSITAAWEFFALMGAGGGIVVFSRWFWWRINAVTELTVFILGISLGTMNLIIPRDLMVAGMQWSAIRFEFKIAFFTLLVLPIGLIVTLATRPVSQEKLESFYRKIRPGGFWSVVSEEARSLPGKAMSLVTIVDIIGGILLCFGISLGIGYLFLQDTSKAIVWFVLGAIGGMWVYYWYRREIVSLQKTNN